MCRKLLKIFGILFIIIFFSTTFVYSKDNEKIDYAWIEKEIGDAKNEEDLNILSKHAVIFDRKSKTIIFGKAENEEVPMASTTKIMTAIVLLENANLDETVEVSKKAALTRWLKIRTKNRR